MAIPLEETTKAVFKRCRKLISENNTSDAIDVLFKRIQNSELTPQEALQVGRLLTNCNLQSSLKISLFGQFTTDWLAQALHTSSFKNNNLLNIACGNYDNVIQNILSMDEDVDIVILIPWHQRFFMQDDREIRIKIKDELKFWQQAWKLIDERSKARIIQVGYDWTDSGAAGQFLSGGSGGDVNNIRTINRRLRKQLPALSYFIDLEQVAGALGRMLFYDARSYFLTKNPISEQGLVFLSRYISAGINSILFGTKKVLVLDLDNTLWGGIVGEVGPNGIELGHTPTGEAFKCFQMFLKQLNKKGCLLAVCSKNNIDDALEPFKINPQMILKLTDISSFKAGWRPKSVAIKEIAKELNLGLDSFVFFDDSKIEQEEVKSALPEVEVVNVPDDPVEYRDALLRGLWFEFLQITKEDKIRASLYQLKKKREDVRENFNDLGTYLRSLNMIAQISTIEKNHLERVVQLIGKTNQFNLTTRRHGRKDVVEILSGLRSVNLCLKLKDKFGEYGLICVILGEEDKCRPHDTLVIDTWLMSCRAIGRSVEHCIFNKLIKEATHLGFTRLVGKFIPTRKNMQVENLYAQLGFSKLASSDDGGKTFELIIKEANEAETFIECVGNYERTSD